MPIWLDTRGRTTLAIGVCDRCKRKFSLDDLMSDPNSPGLKVCAADKDDYDPYRLPPRPPDRIALKFTRPDESLVTDPGGIITESDDYFFITEDGEDYFED